MFTYTLYYTCEWVRNIKDGETYATHAVLRRSKLIRDTPHCYDDKSTDLHLQHPSFSPPLYKAYLCIFWKHHFTKRSPKNKIYMYITFKPKSS